MRSNNFNKYLLGIYILVFISLIICFIRYLPIKLTPVEMGLISSIIGGAISGGLTLIGVKATLENQQNEKFIDLYPKRKIVLDEQLIKMKVVIEFYSNKKNYSNTQFVFYRPEFDKLKREIIDCLAESIIVNGRVYDITRMFLDHLDKINKCIGPYVKDLEERQFIPVPAKIGIKKGKEPLFNLYLDKLTDFYLEIELINKEYDKKYRKLTGA